MDCGHGAQCFYLVPPDIPPPPPIPNYISTEILALLNSTLECNLCFWANGGNATHNTAFLSVSLSTLLVIVAIVSGLIGAGLMAAFYSFKRCKNRMESSSIPHLSRKCNDTHNSHHSQGTSSPTGFSASMMSENTYCEGPYSDSKESLNHSNSNIYAELHHHPSDSNSVWPRTSTQSTPTAVENCYMELSDLPGRLQSNRPFHDIQ